MDQQLGEPGEGLPQQGSPQTLTPPHGIVPPENSQSSPSFPTPQEQNAANAAVAKAAATTPLLAAAAAQAAAATAAINGPPTNVPLLSPPNLSQLLQQSTAQSIPHSETSAPAAPPNVQTTLSTADIVNYLQFLLQLGQIPTATHGLPQQVYGTASSGLPQQVYGTPTTGQPSHTNGTPGADAGSTAGVGQPTTQNASPPSEPKEAPDDSWWKDDHSWWKDDNS